MLLLIFSPQSEEPWNSGQLLSRVGGMDFETPHGNKVGGSPPLARKQELVNLRALATVYCRSWKHRKHYIHKQTNKQTNVHYKKPLLIVETMWKHTDSCGSTLS